MSKPRLKFWGVSLGAGVLGVLLLALRRAIRPPTKARVPDTISPAIFATRVFTTTVGDVIFHESGQGQPLIFLHGVYVGACSYEWLRVYPRFAAEHHVMALDLIGFGESERPHKQFSAADFVQSTAEFIQAQCPDEAPMLVASGLSGAFTVQLAAQHPELVAGLVLIMPDGLRGETRTPWRLDLLSRLPILNRFYYRNYLSGKKAIRTWLEKKAFADASLVEEETVQIFSTCAQQYRAEHAIFNLLRRQFEVDLEKRFAQLPQPVTLIWSETVQAPKIENGLRLQKLKNCQLIALPDAGLLPALELPDEIADIIAGQISAELHVI